MSSNAMFEPMPASAIRAMLAGQVLLMALHVMRLPIWLTGCVTLLVLWSYMARTGRWRLPGRLLRLVVTIGLTAGFITQFRGQFSVDAAAAFFVLTQALKWLELRTRRDAIVLIMIQLYLAAVGFLFDQALLDAALTFSAVAVLLWALNLLQAPDVAQARQLFWGVAKLMLMLSPLVIVLFVLFPRLAPLWSVPLVSNQASSGLSDSMAPGDFNKLVQRSERVFRATFNGPLPPPSARYWRALHLDHFDGRTWSNVEEPPPRRHSRLPAESEATPLKAGEYEILQEPSYQRWAFLLKGSVPLASEMLLNEYGLLRHARPLDTLVRYRLRAASYSGADRLSWADHERLTRIPPGGNPRTRRWIEGLRASEADDARLLQYLLEHFRNEPFHYTLEPPLLGDDSIDGLLFDTRRGFCAHYAGSLVYTLRLAGIPARVVGGYLGGEPGLNGEYLVIRQYDAHAWVDVWLPGRGWVEVDPTAYIAPERVEQDLRSALAEEGSFLRDQWGNAERYQNIALINWLRLRMDAMNYYWQRWVVGYQGQTQLRVLGRWFDNLDMERLWLWTAVGVISVAVALASWVLLLAWLEQRRDPLGRWHARWCAQLRKAGIVVEAGHTPRALAMLCGPPDSPWARANLAMARQLEACLYQHVELDRDQRRRLALALRLIRRTRPTAGPVRAENT